MGRLDNNGYRFVAGDTVCYTRGHYEYLKAINRWPSVHIPRQTLRGTVLEAPGHKVVVRWTNNGEPAAHLPCNLNVVEEDEL